MATKSKLDKETLLDVYNNEYFKINKILQETTGLWPYRSRFDKFIRRFIVLFVLGVVSVPHVRKAKFFYTRALHYNKIIAK